VDWHRLLDNAPLTGLALRTYMLFDNIESFNDDIIVLWHSPRNRTLIPSILACDNQNGITLLDLHFGEVKRLFLFLFYCHLFPLTLLSRKGHFLVKAPQAQAK
jgi:hypothetical protein